MEIVIVLSVILFYLVVQRIAVMVVVKRIVVISELFPAPQWFTYDDLETHRLGGKITRFCLVMSYKSRILEIREMYDREDWTDLSACKEEDPETVLWSDKDNLRRYNLRFIRRISRRRKKVRRKFQLRGPQIGDFATL